MKGKGWSAEEGAEVQGDAETETLFDRDPKSPPGTNSNPERLQLMDQSWLPHEMKPVSLRFLPEDGPGDALLHSHNNRPLFTQVGSASCTHRLHKGGKLYHQD